MGDEAGMLTIAGSAAEPPRQSEVKVVGKAAEAAAPPPKPSAWALPLRIASGILFVPILILLARAGGIAFWSLVALQVTLGLIEFYRMMRGRGLRPYRRLGI